MIANRPTTPVEVPASVTALASGRTVRAVWQNALGGLTFELGEGHNREFVKWAPAASGLDFASEIARLEWAARFSSVPRVLSHDADDTGTWFVTEALPGDSAVADRWKAEPTRAVRAIGEGLRALHDRLPTGECPFDWSVAYRLSVARQMNISSWHPDHRHLSLSEALERLAYPPDIDKLVVCHGDACSPNTLIADDGHWSGHVDLGALGLADRWADLAIATWSTVWNYGPGYEDDLLTAYGIEPDPARIEYYRLLWDMTP